MRNLHSWKKQEPWNPVPVFFGRVHLPPILSPSSDSDETSVMMTMMMEEMMIEMMVEEMMMEVVVVQLNLVWSNLCQEGHSLQV